MRRNIPASLFLTILISASAQSQVTEGFLDTPDGVRLYFEKSGSGAATLILPGRLFLYPDFRIFDERFTVIAYDMRNRGRSSFVQDGSLLTLEHDVQDLETVRRHFGIERFSTVGYSYLGKMVVLYALRHPSPDRAAGAGRRGADGARDRVSRGAPERRSGSGDGQGMPREAAAIARGELPPRAAGGILQRRVARHARPPRRGPGEGRKTWRRQLRDAQRMADELRAPSVPSLRIDVPFRPDGFGRRERPSSRPYDPRHERSQRAVRSRKGMGGGASERAPARSRGRGSPGLGGPTRGAGRDSASSWPVIDSAARDGYPPAPS